MKALIGYVFITFELASYVYFAYIAWVIAVNAARKLGFTRRMTLLDRFARWAVIKLFGGVNPDDFGEFRSRKFRETHQP